MKTKGITETLARWRQNEIIMTSNTVYLSRLLVKKGSSNNHHPTNSCAISIHTFAFPSIRWSVTLNFGGARIGVLGLLALHAIAIHRRIQHLSVWTRDMNGIYFLIFSPLDLKTFLLDIQEWIFPFVRLFVRHTLIFFLPIILSSMSMSMSM